MDKNKSSIQKRNLPGVEKINTDRGYWLVRTKAGTLYDKFSTEDIVAIGWDQITNINGKEDNVVEKIRELYPKEKQPRYAYNQMKRFIKEIKVNDVVLIPSENSEFIRFGIVQSDVTYLNSKEVKEGDLIKRRKVKWIGKPIERKKLDPKMYYLFNSHHIISDASEYGDVIDRTLYPFFVKGDEGHLVIKITRENDISTYDLNILMNNMLKLIEVINDIEGTSYSLKELHQKSNIQSPGFIEFIADKSLILSIGYAISHIKSGTLLEYANIKSKKPKTKGSINQKKVIDIQRTFLESFKDADAEIPKDLSQDDEKEEN